MADTRLRRDIVWNLVPVVLLAGVGLGVNFVIAGWWSAEALATFHVVTITFFVHGVVGACGLQFAVLRAVAEDPDDRDRVAAVVVGALVPNLVLAAAATAVFVALRGPIADLMSSPAVGEGMTYAAPGLFCFSINKVLFGVVNGLRRMRAFAVYTSLRYAMIGVGLVVGRVLDVRADHLPGIWTLCELTVLVALTGELFATVSLRRGAGWRAWARAHLDYGARGVTATLAQEINTKLDVWMLGAAGISKAQVGIYSLAAALTEGAAQLALVLQTNLNPMIAHSLAEGRTTEVLALVQRTRRWFVPSFIATCALGAVIYPLAIPPLIHDPTFIAGAMPFAVLMLGLALASPYLPFSQVLLMANRPGWHTVFLVIVVAINVAGQLAFVPLFGPLGAALGTAIAIVASAVIIRSMSRRHAGVAL